MGKNQKTFLTWRGHQLHYTELNQQQDSNLHSPDPYEVLLFYGTILFLSIRLGSNQGLPP